MSKFLVTRKISIDAAHRVSTHGSKCRNLHGHRYDIEASCIAVNSKLHKQGEQTDMVVDFSFLKSEMIRLIEERCDHGLIVSLTDHEMLSMVCPDGGVFDEWLIRRASEVDQFKFSHTSDTRLNTKLYVIAHQPTAERLAEHWFYTLEQSVSELSKGQAELARVRVWETPNCYADFERAK